MNFNKFILRMKSMLLEFEPLYEKQESFITNGFPAGYGARWEHCYDYIHEPGNQQKLPSSTAAGAALAASVLTSYFHGEKDSKILYRLIYDYSGGAKERILYQRNFAWLLLMRSIENYEVDKSFEKYEADAEKTEIDYLEHMMFEFCYLEVGHLYEDLLYSRVPRHL